MKTSTTGLKKIAVREGTVLHVYKDSKGLPTAGVGHLITPAEKPAYPVGKKITQAQCDAWLEADLKECEDAVNSVGVKLAQNEFDALVSLAFNIGTGGFMRSSVVRRLKQGNKKAAAEAILLWNKPKEIKGRRYTEYVQFLTPYKSSAAPSPSSQPSLSAVVAEQVNPSAAENPAGQEPPLNDPAVTETKVTEVKQTEDSTVATEATVTTPKGQTPEEPPTKVTKNGPLSKWLFSSGGILTIFTGVWGFVQSNGNVIAVAILVLGMLIFAIIFRQAITDAIRMTSAADPDKNNVS